MALTTHLRPSNYSISHKRLKCVHSNNSNHRSRPLSMPNVKSSSSCQRYSRPTLATSLQSEPQCYHRCVQKMAHCFVPLEVASYSPSCSCFFELLTQQSITPPIQLELSRAHTPRTLHDISSAVTTLTCIELEHAQSKQHVYSCA